MHLQKALTYRKGAFGFFFGYLIGSWLVLICIGGIFSLSELEWFILLTLHFLGVLSLVVACFGQLGPPLLVAGVMRFSWLWLDLFSEFPVFGSGGDTEGFYSVSLQIYDNPSLFGTELYGGVFPQLSGALFWLIGPSRIFIQYSNVLLALAGIAIVLATLRELDVSLRSQLIVIWVCCLMPIPAAISATFLRESVITTLVAASFYFFARWLRRGSTLCMALAFSCVAAAASFHLGVLGLVMAYGLTLLFFDRTLGRFSFSFDRLIKGGPLVGLVIAIIIGFPGLFLEKMERITSAEDVLHIAGTSSGASSYLTGIEIDSPMTFLLFSGLKAFLLLISPTPLHWRGLEDVISFTFDGAIFLVAIFIITRGLYKSAGHSRRHFLVVTVVAIISVALVLGAGTGAAGTAMRHRQKVLPIITVATALALDTSRRRKADPKSPKTIEAPLISE